MSSRKYIANCMLATTVMRQTKMILKTIKEIKVLVLKKRQKFLSSR